MKSPLQAAVAASAILLFAWAMPASAQEAWDATEAWDAPRPEPAKPVLARSTSESQQSAFPSAAELRQARAMYRSQQRLARLERDLWMGHEPLRPNVTAIPMMSSRYLPRRVIYFPAFVLSQQ